MTRLRADILLLITALIWGSGFIAQKLGMDGLGPLSFVAARFTLAFLCTLPFAMREMKTAIKFEKADFLPMILLCASFAGGVILQQLGILHTTITNAGFLTGLYVIFVALIGWIALGHKPKIFVWIGCALAIGGTWLLNGASMDEFRYGDWLILGCAFLFGVQVVTMGVLVKRTEKPLAISALQYIACAVIAWTGVAIFEAPTIEIYKHNALALLYSGIVASSIAYTLQAIAQRYTPSSDAAIILSGEALFAALAAYFILHERLPLMGWTGCALIFAAILLVELGVYLKRPAAK